MACEMATLKAARLFRLRGSPVFDSVFDADLPSDLQGLKFSNTAQFSLDMQRRFEMKNLLGNTVKAPALAALLENLGVTETPTINPDSGGIHVEKKDLGFSLWLQDPPTILNRAYSSLPKGTPVLADCFYYSEGQDGYKQFAGELPGGLSFSDGHAQIVARLGEPVWKREKNGRPIAAKWNVDGQSIHITYKKDQPGIKTLAFGIVQNF